MKKLSLIIAALLWAVTAVAEDPCPCAGGTMPFTKICGGGETPNACAEDDCCLDRNIAPTEGFKCCGDEEFDEGPGKQCCDMSVPMVREDVAGRPNTEPTVSGPPPGQNSQSPVALTSVPGTSQATAFEYEYDNWVPHPYEEDEELLEEFWVQRRYVPESAELTGWLRGNQFIPTTLTESATYCGSPVSETVPISSEYTVSVGLQGSINLGMVSVGLSGSAPITLQNANSVDCNFPAVDYEWIYWQIFEHQARPVGGNVVCSGRIEKRYKKYYTAFNSGVPYQTSQTYGWQTDQQGVSKSYPQTQQNSWVSSSRHECMPARLACCIF